MRTWAVLAVVALMGGCSDDGQSFADASAGDAVLDARTDARRGAQDGSGTDSGRDVQPAGDAGADAASGDGASSPCAQLEADYQAALLQAKQCDPVVAMPQCTIAVDSQLACPCTTYANAGHAAAMTELAQLRGQWQQNGCGQQISCPGGCPAAKPNNCQPVAGNSGACED